MKNTKETKKTILEEALIDFKELLSEADKSAREKIIKSMPNKFDEILSEEINKLTNKNSDKEPITEGKDKKELVDNKTSEKKQVNEDVDLTLDNMDTVEDVYDNANQEDEFTFENEEEFNFAELEKELEGWDTGDAGVDIDDQSDVVPDLASETMSVAETDQVTDPYQKFKMLYEKMGEIVMDMENSEKEKMYEAEFNDHINNMFGENHNLSEDVYNSIYEEFKARKMGDPFKDKSLNENENEPFGDTDKKNIAEADENEPFGEKGGETPNVSEMKEVGGKGSDPNKGHDTTPAGLNEEEHEDDKEHDERKEDEKMDEIHGVSYSAGKVRAGTLPNDGQEYRNRDGHERTRAQWGKMSESLNKKIKTLLEDKKKMSKKINEQRTQLTKLEKINEQYKDGLGKYRNHLQEMAVFNTNLAHVNNILVESVDDKEGVKEVINKFKNISNIDESKQVFNQMITEMKGTDKEVIKEEVEEKLNKEIIGESSSVNGDKSKVITESAYKNDAHLNNLNRLINYKLSK